MRVPNNQSFERKAPARVKWEPLSKGCSLSRFLRRSALLPGFARRRRLDARPIGTSGGGQSGTGWRWCHAKYIPQRSPLPRPDRFIPHTSAVYREDETVHIVLWRVSPPLVRSFRLEKTKEMFFTVPKFGTPPPAFAEPECDGGGRAMPK